MWHIYTREYYSVIKKNKIKFAGKMDGIGDHHVK
jgi:hypothetical protein